MGSEEQAADRHKLMEDKELKCWLVVRQFEPMPWPKMLAQAGHGFVGTLEQARLLGSEWRRRVQAYLATGQPRIVLKVPDEKTLHKVFKACQEAAGGPLPCHLVLDEGRTIFSEATYTVIAVGPCFRNELPPVLKRLRILNMD